MKTPHFTSLHKASARLLVARLVKRRERGSKTSGIWQTTIYRRFPKLGMLLDCNSHFILAAVTMRSPSPEVMHLEKLLLQGIRRRAIGTTLLDVGYDSENSHRLLQGSQAGKPYGSAFRSKPASA